jgi:thiamine-phosphate pyrophosphorylase
VNSADNSALWQAAATLGRVRRRGKGLPVVWFVTDPDRTPDPEAIAARLPPGTGVIFRHFGRPGAQALAARLAAVAAERNLVLLIGADAALAAEIGAAGLHLPERRLADATSLKAAHPGWVVTAAAHSADAVRQAEAAGVDAVLLSTVFESRSPSAGAPLGVIGLARIVQATDLPVYALGGVNDRTAGLLVGTGAAGFAAVDGLVQQAV